MQDKIQNEKGVPWNGARAFRSGFGLTANPFKDSQWERMKWFSDWWAENADCFKSHCESGPAYLPGAALTFAYRNWRGETSTRVVQPIRLEYGATSWHPEPQWLLIAWDTKREAERSFAIADINPTPAPDEVARREEVLVKALSAISSLRGYTGEDIGWVAGYRVAAEMAEEGLAKAAISSPPVDPAYDRIRKAFPVTVHADMYKAASFIMAAGQPEHPIACLTGDDHQEKAMLMAVAINTVRCGPGPDPMNTVFQDMKTARFLPDGVYIVKRPGSTKWEAAERFKGQFYLARCPDAINDVTDIMRVRTPE